MRLILAAAAACTFAAMPLQAGEPAPQPQEADKQEAEAPKKICKYVGDTGSRRKTRMCMTADEWRKFNQGE